MKKTKQKNKTKNNQLSLFWKAKIFIPFVTVWKQFCLPPLLVSLILHPNKLGWKYHHIFQTILVEFDPEKLNALLGEIFDIFILITLLVEKSSHQFGWTWHRQGPSD